MRWIDRTTFKTIYLRPSILGSVDGLITSFVIVAGGFASDASKDVIVLIGFSSLIADGISMGVSEALSSRAQDDELSYKNSFLLGLACFLGFVSFGAAPLIGFAIGESEGLRRLLSTLFFVFFLSLTGVFRAYVTGQRMLRVVLEVVLLGCVAGGVAYGIASIRV